MFAVWVPSVTVSVPPVVLPKKVAVVLAPKLTSARSRASDPVSPEICPVRQAIIELERAGRAEGYRLCR